MTLRFVNGTAVCQKIDHSELNPCLQDTIRVVNVEAYRMGKVATKRDETVREVR